MNIQICYNLSNTDLLQGWHYLFGGQHQPNWSDMQKIGEMRDIIKGALKPQIPFENWVRCIEWFKLQV